MKDILFGSFLIACAIALAIITKDGTLPLLMIIAGVGGIYTMIEQNREEQR